MSFVRVSWPLIFLVLTSGFGLIQAPPSDPGHGGVATPDKDGGRPQAVARSGVADRTMTPLLLLLVFLTLVAILIGAWTKLKTLGGGVEGWWCGARGFLRGRGDGGTRLRDGEWEEEEGEEEEEVDGDEGDEEEGEGDEEGEEGGGDLLSDYSILDLRAREGLAMGEDGVSVSPSSVSCARGDLLPLSGTVRWSDVGGDDLTAL